MCRAAAAEPYIRALHILARAQQHVAVQLGREISYEAIYANIRARHILACCEIDILGEAAEIFSPEVR